MQQINPPKNVALTFENGDGLVVISEFEDTLTPPLELENTDNNLDSHIRPT